MRLRPRPHRPPPPVPSAAGRRLRGRRVSPCRRNAPSIPLAWVTDPPLTVVGSPRHTATTPRRSRSNIACGGACARRRRPNRRTSPVTRHAELMLTAGIVTKSSRRRAFDSCMTSRPSPTTTRRSSQGITAEAISNSGCSDCRSQSYVWIATTPAPLSATFRRERSKPLAHRSATGSPPDRSQPSYRRVALRSPWTLRSRPLSRVSVTTASTLSRHHSERDGSPGDCIDLVWPIAHVSISTRHSRRFAIVAQTIALPSLHV